MADKNDIAGPIKIEMMKAYSRDTLVGAFFPETFEVIGRHLDNLAKRLTLMEALTDGVSELDVARALREEESFDKRLAQVERTASALEVSLNIHMRKS